MLFKVYQKRCAYQIDFTRTHNYSVFQINRDYWRDDDGENNLGYFNSNVQRTVELCLGPSLFAKITDAKP